MQDDAVAAPVPSERLERRQLTVLLSCLTAWSAWFIYRTSFVVDGQRVFCLFDDAMISMVYARNWVEGYGLNWARYGRPVEGFSHPLWTFYMAALHLLPVPRNFQSLLVQISSWATLVLNVVAIKRLTQRHFASGSVGLWLPAAALTAGYYPLNQWALLGMEVGLQALLISLSVCWALDFARGKKRETPLMLVLTAGVLLRMDIALLAAVVLGFLAYDGHLGLRHIRRWVPGLVLFATAIIGYQIFRLDYFGEWLPNTYYLKLTGVPADIRVLRGFIVFANFLDITALPLFVIALALIPIIKRGSPYVLPLLVILASFGYSIYVGGDAWEDAHVGANRFQAVVMPLVFVLFNGILNRAISALEQRGMKFFRGHVTIPAATALLLVCNGLWTRDASIYRQNLLVANAPLYTDTAAMLVRQARALREHVDKRAVVAVAWAGVSGYFSDFRLTDELGYNEHHLARLDGAVVDLNAAGSYVPGHAKSDYRYTLTEVKPDVIWQLWGVTPEELTGVYGYTAKFNVWVKNGTPYFHD